DAKKRRAALTRVPGKYEQQKPLHLQESPEERRKKVAKIDAEIAKIQERPQDDDRIVELIEADLDGIAQRAREQNKAKTEAYLAAIDALEKARKDLSDARTDMYRVMRLQGASA